MEKGSFGSEGLIFEVINCSKFFNLGMDNAASLVLKLHLVGKIFFVK